MNNLIKLKKTLTYSLVVATYLVFAQAKNDCSTTSTMESTEKKEMGKYDFLNPLLRNYRIQPTVHRMWLLFASCPEYAPLNEREYLEKLKQGLLTEEEILYPVLPPFNHEWRYYMDSLSEKIEPVGIFKHIQFNFQPEKTKDPFELEEFPDTQPVTTAAHIEDNNREHEYRNLNVKAWAESFEQEALEQVKNRSDLVWYRFLSPDYWAVAPIYKALEASQFHCLKNTLIVTDSYDYTKAFDVSICLACNMQGDWGPVIILKINPRKFMDEARPDEYVIAKQIISAASSYYCKNHTKLIGY